MCGIKRTNNKNETVRVFWYNNKYLRICVSSRYSLSIVALRFDLYAVCVCENISRALKMVRIKCIDVIELAHFYVVLIKSVVRF